MSDTADKIFPPEYFHSSEKWKSVPVFGAYVNYIGHFIFSPSFIRTSRYRNNFICESVKKKKKRHWVTGSRLRVSKTQWQQQWRKNTLREQVIYYIRALCVAGPVPGVSAGTQVRLFVTCIYLRLMKLCTWEEQPKSRASSTHVSPIQPTLRPASLWTSPSHAHTTLPVPPQHTPTQPIQANNNYYNRSLSWASRSTM